MLIIFLWQEDYNTITGYSYQNIFSVPLRGAKLLFILATAWLSIFF